MTSVEVHLAEWQELGPDFAPLRGVAFADGAARNLAMELTKARILEVEELRAGVRVRARAHVGRVRIDPLIITIEPKLGPAELLELFRYAYRLPPLRRIGSADVGASGTLLQDLIAARLLDETEGLMRGGLAKAYEIRDESLASPRGRIDLVAIARGGNASSARLPCRHHVRLADNQLNRVLRAGLGIARAVATDPGLRGAIHRTAVALGAQIGELPLTRVAIATARRRLNRLTNSYEPALRLIELLFESSAISLDDETSLTVPGFLLDMNRFFQALMSRLLSDGLPDCRVQEESALHDMMRYVPGKNPRQRKSPRPRPDFLVTSPSHTTSLLDAKYRDLWARELPRDMLYQLAVYALSQPPPAQAAILYPTTDTNATDAAIEIREPVQSAERAHVVLRPVHLGRLVAAVKARSDDGLRTLARSLAFGGA